MSNTPEGVTFTTDWEDSEYCLVKTLVCSCSTDLLKDWTGYVASHEETIECPNCGAKYESIWEGMTLKKVN